MIKNDETIKIKAIARHHGLFISLTGVITLLLVAWLCNYYWQLARLPLLFMVLACLVTIFIGLLKLAEPVYSVILTSDSLTFYHRHGRWQFHWQQIRNIHCVTNTVGITRDELNYVGIKLISIDTIATCISLRLANRLIHEQKPLIQYCIKHRLISIEQGVLNFEPYILKDGEIVRGPLAAFLHHSEILNQTLGAHIFIAASNLNSSMGNFVGLANTYLTKAKTVEINIY